MESFYLSTLVYVIRNVLQVKIDNVSLEYLIKRTIKRASYDESSSYKPMNILRFRYYIADWEICVVWENHLILIQYMN